MGGLWYDHMGSILHLDNNASCDTKYGLIPDMVDWYATAPGEAAGAVCGLPYLTPIRTRLSHCTRLLAGAEGMLSDDQATHLGPYRPQPR
jgi:hypothetical protein